MCWFREMQLTRLRQAINQCYLSDEPVMIARLLDYLQDYDAARIAAIARQLVTSVRRDKNRQSLVDAFLQEYRLSSDEGIILMSIAEALLRIPDAPTQDVFLREKLTGADWRKHLHHSESLLVNLSTGALLISGKLEDFSAPDETHWQHGYEKLLARLGAPLVRTAIKQAMQQLADRFVFADRIESAMRKAESGPDYLYSFDMLGEAALTAADAERYYRNYLTAIERLASQVTSTDIHLNSGISIKLSALCPRYEPLQHRRAVTELSAKLLTLAEAARQAGIAVTIDAEETERLELSLDIFSAAYTHPSIHGWSGLGLAVQAYQKRAMATIDWLAALAEHHHCKIPLRLVKGAYWDSEIKRAQQSGLRDYPVFTHKTATDVSFLACAKKILSVPDAFYPQFATHNAQTLASLLTFGKNHPGFELQRLHGMGEQLYHALSAGRSSNLRCRIYAPVGNYRDLLPYLVRRLLENGANTSFINQLENPEIDIAELIRDPVAALSDSKAQNKPSIVLPEAIYGNRRKNSAGVNINDIPLLEDLQQALDQLATKHWQACPLVSGVPCSGPEIPVRSPYDNSHIVGHAVAANAETIDKAVGEAERAFNAWRLCPAQTRARYLQQAAELLESNRLPLVSLCIREGGRTMIDALAEVREAVDFCRYYAQCAIELMAQPLILPGPAGEQNKLFHYGRGVFARISPWNFPIAIFIGQISAALAAGNTVIAKPAAQTPLTAQLCVTLLHQAGIPTNVLQLLPGDGRTIGRYLLTDERIAGIAFTGSCATAAHINRQLSAHRQIKPLIAETGGLNVMIVDSSALPEQVVQDVVQSAFNSAGQRCSALRVLFLPKATADKITDMLTGAMQELIIGDPSRYRTDIGPVINHNARRQLTDHLHAMRQEAQILHQLPLPDDLPNGSFFAPCLIQISSLSQLQREIFGPVLHLIRYDTADLQQVIDAVNASGYGLTLGVHSRIESRVRFIQERVRVGNLYVNRNMIGAVVGVQPFGGMGLSGSGPKAGGPGYLPRFVVEQTLTTNTAAIGGNPDLLALDLR